MRAASSNLCLTSEILGCFPSASNSLCRNIAPVTTLESIFCWDDRRSIPNKLLRMNSLENSPTTSAEIYTKTGLQADSKSLFRNILPVSPCGSRFCSPIDLSPLGKSFGMNILAGSKKEIVRGYTQTRPVPALFLEANSLFYKILPVSPSGSIFCPDMSGYLPGKSFRMNILEETRKRLWGAPSDEVHPESLTAMESTC